MHISETCALSSDWLSLCWHLQPRKHADARCALAIAIPVIFGGDVSADSDATEGLSPAWAYDYAHTINQLRTVVNGEVKGVVLNERR